MASNGRNEVSLCKCMLYHSASGRTRRSNNRYLHISTPLAQVERRCFALSLIAGARRPGVELA